MAINFRGYGGHYDLRFSLQYAEDQHEVAINSETWADWDQQGRLVYARDGALFAGELANGRIVERQIADFNSQKPQLIKSPEWARVWSRPQDSLAAEWAKIMRRRARTQIDTTDESDHAVRD
ncbi:MAG TPA: hypothetical protein VMT34_06305 [Aggregatilineales bacterium]|nr:hypothetical protein [Aggregatilineales bacterium]